MCRPCHADTCLLSDGVVFWLLLFLSVLIPTFSLYPYNVAYNLQSCILLEKSDYVVAILIFSSFLNSKLLLTL